MDNLIKKYRTFVMGDIHGEFDKFKGLLELIKFDYENDTLVQLGDICDRGLKVYECVEELLKIKNLICLKGNHDETWFSAYKEGRLNPLHNQGGHQTNASYRSHCHEKPEYPYFEMPKEHFDFFVNQKNYYVDENNDCFVHGGFDRHFPIEGQDMTTLLWDRDLFLAAMSYESMNNKNHKFKVKDKFKRIFVGHTPTIYWNDFKQKPITTPIKAANMWNLDTGCGKGDFPLTAMNLDTEEYFQFNTTKK